MLGGVTILPTTVSYLLLLQSLYAIDVLSNWNTSQVADMFFMFFNCSYITSLQPIFDWDVSSLTSKDNIFNSIPTSVERPGW